jgi:hypothetical protein
MPEKDSIERGKKKGMNNEAHTILKRQWCEQLTYI